MKSLIFLTAFLFSLNAIANVTTIRTVDPSVTGKGIYRIKGDHQVLEPSIDASNGLLMITIGGTNSSALEFKNVQNWAAEKGYTVLGIDYPNGVICTTCREMPRLDCWDFYRREIMTGDQVSDIVNVNKANSIIFRIQSLITYLIKTDGISKWSQFLNPDFSIDWTKVVVIGHSQGSGHAAYLGKLFPLQGVVMVAGPHDSWIKGSAPWLALKGKTPPEKYTSLLHENDFFGREFQEAAARVLMDNYKVAAVKIKTEIPKGSSRAQIFVSNAPFKDPHNSLCLPEYSKVWDFLLNRLLE